MSEMNAIDLDMMLQELTPEQAEHARSRFGSAWHDQAATAQKDALEFIQALNGNRHSEWVPFAKTINNPLSPAWLRLGALDAYLQWHRGQAKTCQHVLNPMSPMPVLTAAWKPGIVACEFCAPVLFKVWGDADKTCDGCGHICDVDNGDLIATTTVLLGSFGYQAGMCINCDSCPDETVDGQHRTGTS